MSHPTVVTQADIQSIIATQFNKQLAVVQSAESITEIAAESLDKLELVCALEDYYGIHLSLDDIAYFTDWNRTISHLQFKVDEKRRAL